MFSNSAYAGMRTLVALGRLEVEADMSARFLKTVNDLFDLMNVLCYGTGVRPLNRSCTELQKLIKLKDDLLSWHVSDPGAASRPPCFDGFTQAVNATLVLHEQLVLNGQVKFLMTGRLNQDCIENFFQPD